MLSCRLLPFQLPFPSLSLHFHSRAALLKLSWALVKIQVLIQWVKVGRRFCISQGMSMPLVRGPHFELQGSRSPVLKA